MIDFSNYNLWFKDYILEKGIIFKTQKEADAYYKIWIEGFNCATYAYAYIYY